MGERKWTAAQLEAIMQRGKNILVSAAAGSGKTAVLVERIIRRITDPSSPVDIDRLLVVTFTDAAAAEMRERIGRAIEQELDARPDSEELARQLALLGRASITTIHSFCLEVVRQNFTALGLDPGFRVADETEAELIRADALAAAVDEMYEDAELGGAFADLVEAYSNPRREASLYELAGRIYSFVRSLPFPEQWLDEAAQRMYPGGAAQTDTCAALYQYASEELRSCAALLRRAYAVADEEAGLEPYAVYFEQRIAEIERATACGDFWEQYGQVHAISWPRMPALKRGAVFAGKERAAALCKQAKQGVAALAADVFNLTREQYDDTLRQLYPPMHCLSEFIKRLDMRYSERKRDKNVLDFSDLEHFALAALLGPNGVPTDAARALSAQFEEIYMDEYQDTSRIQETIFGAICRPDNLFLVGDIKQSIYRFRNTDPQLFLHKRDTYTIGGSRDRKIVLSNNFRSAPQIIACINYVFERLMSRQTGGVDYDETEALYPGLEYQSPQGAIARDATLCFIEMDDDEEQEQQAEDDEIAPAAMELEALLAAKKIGQLVSGQYKIAGREGYRPVRFRDCAVLLRTVKGWSDVFGQVFAAMGIPCYSDKGTGFFMTGEVEAVVSMLKVLDNPYQDIPLLAVLRSPFFLLTADELADIRLADMQAPFYTALCNKAEEDSALGGRIREVLDTLGRFRALSRHCKLDDLLWRLYTETGFYEFQGAQAGGELRQANLRTLLTRAASFEKTSFRGLYSFVSFLDRFRASGGDFGAAKLLGDEHDVVRIMSIHKSKGLEFPVVLLCGLGKRFNMRDMTDKLLIDPELGYGPKRVDLERRVSYNTPVRQAICHKQTAEALSEEMRLLYVALTRAREKLILIGTVRKLDARLSWWTDGQARHIPPAVVSRGTSYLDWMGLALLSHPGCTVLRSRVQGRLEPGQSDAPWHVELYTKYDFERETVTPGTDNPVEPDPVLAAQLREILDFQYPRGGLRAMPSKVTVTELKNLEAEETDTVYLYPRPLFMERKKLSAAQLGNVYHTILQRMDLHTADIPGELERLRVEGFLTQTEYEAAQPQKLARLLDSPLGRRLRQSSRVDREVMFAMPIGVGVLMGDSAPGTAEDGEQLLLQGVIDCVFEEDGKPYIIDYKTERYDSRDAVAEKYRPQLAYYALAVERMYGQPAAGKYLYMLDKDEIIEL